MSATTPPSLVLPRDVLRLGSAGLRARPLRALLAALGIAIGIGAMVAVVGVSSSSQAELRHQLASLGTNLLTVTPGKSWDGTTAVLPPSAVPMIARIEGVESAAGVGVLTDVNAYRSPLIDPENSNSLQVAAADLSLRVVIGATLQSGTWLNPATATFPTVVLGATAAARLGVVTPGVQITLGGQQFTVIGILRHAPLAPEVDTMGLIGEPVAARLFGYQRSVTSLFTRATDERVPQVWLLLGRTANPESPDEVQVSRPSDALSAKNAADQAFTRLLVGIGSIALLVGGIGVANTMVISVLERRREIGLRRALGATRGHVRVQFLTEALLLSLIGGSAGVLLGIGVTSAFCAVNSWPVTVPTAVVGGAVAATLAIGGLAGVFPAIRAARVSPTAALS